MNKDFNNNIPDFSKRRIGLKVILFLLVISLAILVVQLFFKESLSFIQGNFTIINSFVAFILLFLKSLQKIYQFQLFVLILPIVYFLHQGSLHFLKQP